MADPMTQSAQISSSQGLADRQNSVAAKDSKMSDSFLSSSPVSLIQSPQVLSPALEDEKHCEGIHSTRCSKPSPGRGLSPGPWLLAAPPPLLMAS
ncbi:hypothetical protein J4Q44_G00379630 [Coregonus suidteri]|uniref:Uncharacterized protein n=1 Tax=Coregonus suidteri TaxID=861788 RepID=A0AAN8KIP5_9TELE